MANVMLICGRICSGKTTYARKLCEEKQAILLSVDELMLSLFGQHAGDKHDLYAARSKSFLLGKAVALIRSGVSVVLDWGFWTNAERKKMKAFFLAEGIKASFYYLDIPDDEWEKRIEKRNLDVQNGKTDAYYIDENLAEKFRLRFEKPEKTEIDVWLE